MGIVVPRPVFPIPIPHTPRPPRHTHPKDSWELQLLIFLGKSLPLSLPASLGPQPQDPKLRTSLSLRGTKTPETASPGGICGTWGNGRRGKEATRES